MLAVFGLGNTELLIIGLVCLAPLLAGLIVIAAILLSRGSGSRCDRCGAINSKSARYCQQCGEAM